MAQLEFSINSKEPVAIITLKGSLTEATATEVQRIRTEIEEHKNISYWGINLKDLSEIKMVAHRDFVSILNLTRGSNDKKTIVKISGLNSKLVEYLKQYGLVRDHEIGGDLKTTLSTILQYKIA